MVPVDRPLVFEPRSTVLNSSICWAIEVAKIAARRVGMSSLLDTDGDGEGCPS